MKKRGSLFPSSSFILHPSSFAMILAYGQRAYALAAPISVAAGVGGEGGPAGVRGMRVPGEGAAELHLPRVRVGPARGGDRHPAGRRVLRVVAVAESPG